MSHFDDEFNDLERRIARAESREERMPLVFELLAKRRRKRIDQLRQMGQRKAMQFIMQREIESPHAMTEYRN